MKERLLNVIKWVLITLGALFLIQMLIVIGIIVGINNFSHNDYDFSKNSMKNLKEIQSVIKYVEKYYSENGRYPERIESNNIKIKPDVYYNYKVNDDGSCYTITTNTKNNSLTKQYQHCSSKRANSNTNSQSYVEFKN